MDQLIPAIAAFLAGIGAYLAGKARHEAKSAGQILNGGEETRASGNPRIYDMVFDLHKQGRELVNWKRSYDGGPLDSGPKVATFVERVDGELASIRHDVHEIRANCAQCQDESPPAA